MGSMCSKRGLKHLRKAVSKIEKNMIDGSFAIPVFPSIIFIIISGNIA